MRTADPPAPGPSDREERGVLAAAGEWAREVLAQTCGLVAPRDCPCGTEGAWLCTTCRALLSAPPVRVDATCDALQQLHAARVRDEGPEAPAGVDHVPLMPVWALGEYGGDLQRIVLAWKNGGRLHLGPDLAQGLAPAVTAITGAAGLPDDGQGPDLLPVPSRLAARLRRGEDHTAELVRELAARGLGRPLLLRASPTNTQEGLGSRGRRRRGMLLDERAARRAARRGAPVVIVDDVVTTGSTLRALHGALTAAGLEVLGAAVVAAARIPAPVGLPGGGNPASQDR